MSEKNRDAKNRWRTVTVAFRLSPEENEELTNRVKDVRVQDKTGVYHTKYSASEGCGYRQSANAGIISAEFTAY